MSIEVIVLGQKFVVHVICCTTRENTNKVCRLSEPIKSAFNNNEINWQNADTIGLDNANMNIGKKNLIKWWFLKKEDSFSRCNCHLAHLAASAGENIFQKINVF